MLLVAEPSLEPLDEMVLDTLKNLDPQVPFTWATEKFVLKSHSVALLLY